MKRRKDIQSESRYYKSPDQLIIGIKGAGEMATGVAWQLFRANIKKIFMMEVPAPLAVRRTVSFCEAVTRGEQVVEGVAAVRTTAVTDVFDAFDTGRVAVVPDPEWQMITRIQPDVVIDATIAKRNLGTTLAEAPLVIGLGPGFAAGKDVHLVIETSRGHDLGRVIEKGAALKNTGIPGTIGGYSVQRVLRAPCDGRFQTDLSIGCRVEAGDVIGRVEETPFTTEISGVLRGLIRPGSHVTQGMKMGDIDPRGDAAFCYTISDKARALGGNVLQAVLNRTCKVCSGLADAMNLNFRGVVSLIGGGGKTSLMFRLAHDLAAQGRRVLATTTTRILMPDPDQCRQTLLARSAEALIGQIKSGSKANPVAAGEKPDETGCKLIGFDPGLIDQVWQTGFFDVIIVEADGAKHKPVKASAAHEPVLPSSTTHLVHVTGLDGVGRPITDEYVHRSGIFLENLDLMPGTLLDESMVARAVDLEIKKAAQMIGPVVAMAVLNKADTDRRYQYGKTIQKGLQHSSQIHRVLLTRANRPQPVLEWADPVKL